MLRQFLIWIEEYKEDDAELSRGLLWGGLLVASPCVFTTAHHQNFWCVWKEAWHFGRGWVHVQDWQCFGLPNENNTDGCTPFKTLETELLVHWSHHDRFSFVATLNRFTPREMCTGHVVNLMSNDLKRFEFALAFSPYLIIGPFETIFVLVALSLYLGLAAAIIGTSCYLLLIPVQVCSLDLTSSCCQSALQSFLSKYIRKCRQKTAVVTDRRISMTGELITGNLAIKMLGWEDPLREGVEDIRQKEQRWLLYKSCIKSLHAMMPGVTRALAVCATFITVRPFSLQNGSHSVCSAFAVQADERRVQCS